MNHRSLLSRFGGYWSLQVPNGRLLSTIRTIMSADVAILTFRWVVIACQAATILITWPMWQVRDSPPMLPAMPLPYIDMGLILLLSLALILAMPKTGIIVHTALVVYAVIIDQTRLQPEIISLVFLLWGTLPNPNAKAVARFHLIALWLFAGFNKLLSPGFMNGTAQWMLHGLISDTPVWLRDNFGYVIVAMESGTGLLALVPRTRKIAGLTALCLHLGILLDLSPIGHNWNESVWPWNVALALSGLALIAPWKESPLQSLRQSHWAVRLLAIYLLISPLGFYIGITDAYLAHNLYTDNTASASTSGSLNPYVTWSAFHVPLPPEHRLFEQFFYRSCHPGDRLYITDSRWWFRLQGLQKREIFCPKPQREGS